MPDALNVTLTSPPLGVSGKPVAVSNQQMRLDVDGVPVSLKKFRTSTVAPETAVKAGAGSVVLSKTPTATVPIVLPRGCRPCR
jgi:hypothetical protein